MKFCNSNSTGCMTIVHVMYDFVELKIHTLAGSATKMRERRFLQSEETRT